MIQIIFFTFFIALPTIIGQYMDTGVKPDVTFGDHNNRFDLSDLMQHQNKYFDSTKFRRQLETSSKKEYGKDNVSNKNNGTVIVLIKKNRRVDDNFKDDWAYHDNMVSLENDGGKDEYERNLKAFKTNDTPGRRKMQGLTNVLHRRKTRRNMNPEKEILLNHAVPFTMNIEGFMQVPFNR